MLELAPNMAFALLACVGAGAVFLRGVGLSELGEPLFALGWSGLAGIGGLAFLGGALNLVLPLRDVSLWILVPSALWGAVRGVQWLRGGRWELLVLVGLFLALLVFSARLVLHGDTGNYHHQAVLWMAGWQLPPGLANLHGRFGFNSSWWAFSGLLEYPWLARGASIYMPVGALTYFFGMLVIGSAQRFWTQGLSVSCGILLTSSYLWFRQFSGINNPSFSTDAPANLLIVASAAAFAEWLLAQKKEPVWFLLWCALAATAATVKLTAVPWLAFSAIAASGLLFSAFVDCNRHKIFLCRIVSAILLGLLIVSTYAVRGVLISGYPFYPLKMWGFSSLPWAVPLEILSKDTSGIRDWPTRGSGGPGMLEFAWTWIENQFGLTNIIFGFGLLLMALGLAVIASRHFRIQKLMGGLLRFWPLLAAAACGFIVCFTFAPALRFVSGYFFVAAGICIGILLGLLRLGAKTRAAILLFLTAATIIGNFVGLFSRNVILVGTPQLPQPEVVEMSTDQGEIVRVNKEGFSWATDPPATPYFDPNLLVLRDNKGIIRAFKVQP